MTTSEVEARIFNLVALNKASRMLTSILDLDRLTALAVDIVGEMGQSLTCALYLVERDGAGFTRAAAKSVVGVTLPARFATADAPVDRDGVLRHPFEARCRGVDGPVTVIPLRLEGRLFGFFLLHEPIRAEAMTRESAETLETLAAQVAASVQNARLYSELRVRLDEIERAHAQLQQAEARYRTLVEQIPAVTYTSALDAVGSTLYISPQIMAWGYTPDEWLADPELWAKRLHPDDRERVLTEYVRATVTREKFKSEYRLLDRGGREMWARDEAVVLCDDAGRPVYMHGVRLDLTDQKRAEAALERERAQSAQREKLGAMSELLAGVAHELNNPLAVVIGHAAILRQRAAGTPHAERAEKLGTAADRCARLVKNFLSLARQHPPERSAVRLNQVIDEAMELLAYPLRVDDVQVERDFDVEVPTIAADPHQLHQVVVNLVTNAHHALRTMASGRRIELATRLDRARGRVVLRVRDNGPGIPPDIVARIFEPFFTTKPTGQGTGLGLSLCQGIVESHGGSIGVESAPGQGATFVVELPAQSPRPVAKVAAVVTSPAPRGGAILVVDDEPQVLDVLADLLAVDGHTVDTARNGADALEKLRQRAYDVVLTDLRMPELGGPGLWREVERTRPDLAHRFVLLTGDVLNPETRAFLEESGLPRLSKPFDFAEVRAAVRRVLEGGAG